MRPCGVRVRLRWCWRCQRVLPMLDEDEFWRISALIRAGFAAARSRPREGGLATVFTEALREYERITGFAETNGNALSHHRIALYGPDCAACGRPLRTKAARHCASCGAVRREAGGGGEKRDAEDPPGR